MPSTKKRITTYLTDDEYRAMSRAAAQAGLSLSKYVKRVCLGHAVTSTVDYQAFLALTKANADLGRLGGLFKMSLSEGSSGSNTPEIRRILKSIELSKENMVRRFNTLVEGLSTKQSRKP
ncbi:CopG family transcriptional regulator [Desulfobulbus rhabdoformis]|uniref:plasmid mobilization protein n=1 Tax=Desulfobulbus rhabdoformis TaxID=34032 RepID=UPI0019628CC3|nr:CopG family transcriptional regulator [Desulfobulbus rhabdoformis]MBM9616830.1 CopG family transcriptional regulator [Desulfobulbus rhabdoformis]